MLRLRHPLACAALLALVGLGAGGCYRQACPSDIRSEEATVLEPVQGQLEAYNARDLEGFLLFFAPDVVIEDGQDRVLMQGHAQMRERYGPMFAQNPQLHCRIASRIRIGPYVIDEERITGRGPEEVHAVAIYRVVEGRIVHVRFLRP